MKQSSVEYLIEMIRLNDKDLYAMLFEDKVFEQAKEMHKEEIIKAWKIGDGKYDITADEMSLGYYKEIFEGGNK